MKKFRFYYDGGNIFECEAEDSEEANAMFVAHVFDVMNFNWREVEDET